MPRKTTTEQPETTPRGEILLEAKELIEGDRNVSYGSPTQNFANTAALLNIQFGHKLSEPFTAADVAVVMMQLKLARLIASPKRDTWVDIAGYAACGYEASREGSDRPSPAAVPITLFGIPVPKHIDVRDVAHGVDAICRHLSHEGGFPGRIIRFVDCDAEKYSQEFLRAHAHGTDGGDAT